MIPEISIIIVCMLAAIILFIAEVFFFPGITFAGIIGTVFAFGGIWYAYQMDTFIGHMTIFSSIIIFALIFFLMLKSRSFKKMELTADIDSKVKSSLDLGIKVGDKGVTVSRLASVGKANINKKIVEVKAENGWINENTDVYVTRIEDNYIWVTSA